MKLIDTNSKGNAIFKSKGGAYFSVPLDELKEAVHELTKALAHRNSGLPRVQLDSRRH